MRTVIPLDSAIAWDAGQQLSAKTASSRAMKTVISGTRHEFHDQQFEHYERYAECLRQARKKINIINFIRGVDTYDEDD